MDWAASQWKQELPPLAVQKINALEEKIERLQKERQQKQLQCECLELALEKEKRKVENEKQQTTASQRELQSLADVCKDFEDKQQRLQNELQNRENRIASLEGMLSQAKKENCRLQQTENHFKELRGVREATLLEREHKNESFNSEQNAKLQGKKINLLSDSLIENSEISILAEKENNKYALNENDLLSSLRKKISDQEKIIQELNLKLVSISDKESTKELHHTYSKTPGRPQMESVGASPALRIKSVWGSFTSTPAKENKETVLRHHGDSIATGSSDEKLMALQIRLKQLCQELDCQRHNFEASKVSMEQKFKEQENALKAELKYQAQANADLDKELKDIRNKYQQEINQSTKKLDILTAQLTKTEEAKAILEKEVKNIESKISVCTLSLKTKEEEVQDLQKLKNMADTTIQSLQVQVRDLERKCRNIQEQNSTLSETVKSVELQLEGSCNLAQGREADLAKVKKELENLSVSHKNLLNENQELQNRIMTSQTKTEELLQNETILKEQVELMEKEQNQLTDQLNLEIKKSENLAFTVEEQKSQISLQKEELSLMESKLTELNKEFADTKFEFEAKIQQLEMNLNTSQKEYAGLENKLKEYSLVESSLKEKLEQISNEKEEAVSQLTAEKSARLNLESSIVELKNQIKLLEEEIACKSLEYDEMKKRTANLKIENEAQLQELERKSSLELVAVQKQLESISSNEKLLSNKLQVLEKEKEELNSNLADESFKIMSLLAENEKQRNNILSLQEKLSAKTLDLENLNQVKETLAEELNAQIQALETTLSTVERDYADLQIKVKEISLNELSLKEKLELIEKEKEEAISLLKTENNLRQSLESSISDLNDQIKSLKEESAGKTLENNELKNTCGSLETDFKAKIHQLEINLNTSQKEYAVLENKLKEYSLVESSLKEKLEQISNEKEEAVSKLTAEKSTRLNLESSIVELKNQIKLLEEEIACKSLEYDEMKKRTANLKIENEAQLQELERKSSSELMAVQKRLESISSNEKLLSNKLQVLEKEKEELNSNLTEESSKIMSLLAENEKQKSNILSLQEKLSAKAQDLENLNQVKETLAEELNNENQELQNRIMASQTKTEELLQNETILKEQVELMEKEQNQLTDQLNLEIKKSENLAFTVEEQKSQISLQKEELSLMESKLTELNKEFADTKFEFEAKLQQLEINLNTSQKEYADLENKLKEYSLVESSLKEKLEQISNEKEEAVFQLTAEKSMRLNLESSIVQLKNQIKLLEEEIACKSLEYDEMKKTTANLKIEHEAQLQELERKSSSELVAVQKQLESISSNEKLLSNKLQVLEKEKEELNSNLAEESSKIMSLLAENEKQRSNILSLQEKLSAETLAEELNNENQELQNRIMASQTKTEELLQNETILKEQVELMEKEQNQLTDQLNLEIKKSENLAFTVEEQKSQISLQKEELSLMESKLTELNKEFADTKFEFEAKLQQLEINLNTSQKEYADLENKLKEYSLVESSLKEKLEQISNEKEEAVFQLTAEKSMRLNLESSIVQLKNQIKLLEEEIACKSLEYDEMKKTTANLKIEHEAQLQELERKSSSELVAVQKQLESISSNEKLLSNKLQVLEKEKEELNSNLAEESSKIMSLLAENEKQKSNILSLEEKLSAETLDFENLNQVKETLAEELNNENQELQNRIMASQTKTEELLQNETILKEQVELMEKEQNQLTDQLNLEIKKSENLAFTVEEQKSQISLQKEELSLMESKLTEFNKEFADTKFEFEAKIQALETTLSTVERDYADLQIKVKEISLNELSLKEKLELIEKEKEEAISLLKTENNLRQSLESSISDLNDQIKSLKEESAGKTLENNELKNTCGSLATDFKAKIQQLEISLNTSQKEYAGLENKLKEYSLVESSLKEKLEQISNEKEEAVSQLTAEKSARLNLESSIVELKNQIKLLEEEIACKSLEYVEMKKRTANLKIEHEAELQELERKSSSELVAVQKQLESISCNEKLLSNKLQVLEKEKEELNSNLAEESSKIMSLLAENEKQRNNVSSLQEKLSAETLDLDNLNQVKETPAEELNEQLSIMSKNEKSILEEMSSLKKEKDSISEELDSAKNEVQKLQAISAELELHIQVLNKEVTQKSSELGKIQNQVLLLEKEYEAKVEELENKLLCSSMPKKLNGSFSKELRLDEKVAPFCISSFEENLSLRSFEYDELFFENETLKEEFERAIQKLQAEISGVKSENEHLRVKMKDVSLNAEMFQNRLELVEKEKQNLDRQLNFENKKIKMLESGIQELKKIILTLQVLLISYNGDMKGLNSQMAGSKDCSEFKDEVMFNSLAAEKEYVSTTRAESESFPTFFFPEFRSFSSLPEKEFSTALEKFSFYSLNQICDLESNLISKLERFKFLCSYQLVDHVQLNDMWKIFLFLRRKLGQIQLLKKFMFCFCNILKSSLVAHILHSVNKVALVKVFPKNFGFTLKDFLYLCNNAFNKILFSISQTFERDLSLVNHHSVFFNKYSNIHSNAFHLPVIKKTSFVLCQAKFQRVHWDLKPKHVSKQKLDIFSARRQDVKKALDTLNAQEVPFFLNFTMSVMEKFGKEFCHSSNDFTGATSGHFSNSALQMKNYLSLLEPSSPIFQILSKYCIDILNLENIAVHDICYWKHHCNILGIDKCDVQKMITLLEHMDKHKKSENGIGNTLSGNKHTKAEVTAPKNEKCLEQCLKIEKERQKLLNITIEEIEKDLGKTFLQKEKFKNMALNVGKMLLCLKKYDAESFVFSNIQLDEAQISTEMCFCENCVMDEDMSDSRSHNVLTLDHCLKCMDRLIRSGCRLEKEVCELKKDEPELKALSRSLQDKNSELEMTVDQCNRNLETAHNQMQDLTYNLQKQKEKYEYLLQSVNEKDTLNMQLQAENSILLNSIEEYRTKLKVLEEEVSLLSINQEKLEFSLLCKDREIASLKATFDGNVCKLNETQMKCEEYKNEIHLLSSRISKYEEEKMIDQHMISQNVSFDNSFVPDDLVKSSKTIINELQAKIDSLTKSNNSLNLSIKKIEEELKNVYMEKKGVEELEKLSEQIAYFKQEISVSTQKYNDEKKSNENLLLRLKEYEKLMLDNEHIIKQLKTKNETLEKNACLIKNVTKEHDQVVSKKNSDLTRCHQFIEQLQKRIAELDKANSNLKVQTKVIKNQECLKLQLNEIISQKSELEKEIKRLKLVETEKDQILGRLSEANLQRDNLTEQFRQLTLEFETQKKKNTDLEVKCTELSSSLKDVLNSNTSLEEELNKNKNVISILNKQLEESSFELKNIRSIKCKLITEISTLKATPNHLTQKIETLTKNLKDAQDNVKAECNKNQLLMKENETLKMNGNTHANIGTELQKLKNTLNGAYNFIVNVLNTILCAVQIYPECTDFEELRVSLRSLIVHCTQNSEKEFQVDMMFEQLNSFFGTLINNHKEYLVICGLISSIKDSVKSITTIDEPCQGAEASLFISPDTMCNMSVFESTFVRQANCNILADLHYIKARTDEIIFNFKKIISEKTEEIEKLKKECKQIPFESAKNESKPTELEKTSFKWKYELVKRQYRQLEEKYNAVVISSEQMENTIKKLEVENKNLEEEAEDLSNEIKDMQTYYSNSDELLEALTELNALRQKFKELENENKWLKKEIQEFQLQQKSADKTSSGADLNSLRYKLKELEKENNWLRKRIQKFQLQQTSAEEPSSSSNQRQTQIPKFDKAYLKENNGRFMKGS